MGKLTPMMQQYVDIKEKYKHCILFFRLGDFYEMFFDDAILASKELDITLTGKDCGLEERAPMCGIPFHAVDGYIAKLVQKGYKVAICEQMEEPKPGKTLVKRDVIRVVTPGTILDGNVLDANKNNYIAAVYGNKNGCSLAVCDVTTGEFQTTGFTGADTADHLVDEIARFSPAELICNEDFHSMPVYDYLKEHFETKIDICADWMFEYHTAYKLLCNHFHIYNLDGMGLGGMVYSVCASGGLMQYLCDTQKNDLSHITVIKPYTTNDFMFLDLSTRRNLELTETIRAKERKGTLLWVLDKTKTPMGARLLRKWIEQPLIDPEAIYGRLEAVHELKDNDFFRQEIRATLGRINDFERIMGKISYQTANCRDLLNLKASIVNLPLLKELLRKGEGPYLKVLYTDLDTLEQIYALIQQSIVEEKTPISLREGGMIKKGYHKELDMYLIAKEQGDTWIKEFAAREREATGIKNLKVHFNKVFGYYIEITKSNLADLPEGRYIRKQTLANCERFTTDELDHLAEIILNSQEKIVELEYNLFCQIRSSIAKEMARIQKCSQIVAAIDVLQSLAEVAQLNHYEKPELCSQSLVEIQDGRHPVVERTFETQFIPNDTMLDSEENQLSIITGPNMAGKSTYMRQVALIVLMAQIGSFVPAKYARLGITDRIFTRVGASDDLASGQSTFMVEMIEVANILNNASKDSLLVLDEIGRGTSTFDGLSLAWAVLEYIADKSQVGAKTLFATHYHELTELEGKLSGVKNYCILVKEQGDDITFLRKIARGGADNSYGIQVAKLAGLPPKVITRAKDILQKLSANDIAKRAKELALETEEQQNQAIQAKENIPQQTQEERELLAQLAELDVMALTPINALQTLLDLQIRAKRYQP